MIQVRVRNIGLDALTGAPIVMLENIENTDEIYPIWIGVSEAEGIIIKQSGVETPRPLTYDLMKNIIETLGGQVKYVAVVDKKDNAYIAEIVIDKDGEELHIDARPSDAINIALRFDAPIYLEENVVQKVSLKEIQEAIQKAEAKEKAETEKEAQEVKETVTEVVEEPEVDEELEQFRKMLENIKPEDFAIKPEDKKDKN
ncbi:bifunctional nuclease family protein [Persephonella sp. IF05-L8]|uniref:bifunctional nuclease domain-containing protein n=1 Tax=Persephonella sp. IF05-L8 TaxID=1158338 RepID=UPI0004976A52